MSGMRSRKQNATAMKPQAPQAPSNTSVKKSTSKSKSKKSGNLSATIFLLGVLSSLALAFAFAPTGLHPLIDGLRMNIRSLISEHFGPLPEPPLPAPKSTTTRRKLLPDAEKQKKIVNAFKHAWFAYERDAFGSDVYHPISRTGTNLTHGANTGVGLTIADTLDTLLLFSAAHPEETRLKESYERSKAWISGALSFEKPVDEEGEPLIVNTFEVTIRVLGGLLGAHYLEKHLNYTTNTPPDFYINHAKALADRLLVAFQTPSGLPYTYINLWEPQGYPEKDGEYRNLVSLAEVGTMGLEFRYLSQLLITETAIDHEQVQLTYWYPFDHITALTKRGATDLGRLPSIFLNPEDGNFVMGPIRLGSRGDSWFEYLLKQYLQTGQVERDFLDMWNDAMDRVNEMLYLMTPATEDGKERLSFIAELMPEEDTEGHISWRREPKQDHLTCFLPGTILLASATTPEWDSEERKEFDWDTGMQLLKSCLETHKTKTGLAPEIAHFRTATEPDWVQQVVGDVQWYIKGNQASSSEPAYDARYTLRPETLESLFYAYRLTGDEQWRERAWEIFEAIERHCRREGGGYAGVLNVDDVAGGREDRMESFFLSETLKYLWLIFSGDEWFPLDDVVFSTEAHVFPKFKLPWKTILM